MGEGFEITDAMKAKVGKDSPPWVYEVTTTGVRAFARGVGYTDPVYYDMEAAKKAGYRNLPAPPTFHGLPVYIPGKSDETFSTPNECDVSISQDEHGLPNIMDGGTECEHLGQICAGDTLTCITKLADLSLKVTGSGKTMLIQTIQFTFTNQDGEKVLTKRLKVINH